MIPTQKMWCHPPVRARTSHRDRVPETPTLPLSLCSSFPGSSGIYPRGSVGQSPAGPPGMLPNPSPYPDTQPWHPRYTAQGSRTLKLGGTKDASELIPPTRAGKIIALCLLQEAQRPLVPF